MNAPADEPVTEQPAVLVEDPDSPQVKRACVERILKLWKEVWG